MARTASWFKQEEAMAALLYTNEEEAKGNEDQQLVHAIRSLCMQFICIPTSTNLNVFPFACKVRKGIGKREFSGPLACKTPQLLA
jgi:hypothetical protein